MMDWMWTYLIVARLQYTLIHKASTLCSFCLMLSGVLSCHEILVEAAPMSCHVIFQKMYPKSAKTMRSPRPYKCSYASEFIKARKIPPLYAPRPFANIQCDINVESEIDMSTFGWNKMRCSPCVVSSHRSKLNIKTVGKACICECMRRFFLEYSHQPLTSFTSLLHIWNWKWQSS